jgi:hypothetical protein
MDRGIVDQKVVNSDDAEEWHGSPNTYRLCRAFEFRCGVRRFSRSFQGCHLPHDFISDGEVP